MKNQKTFLIIIFSVLCISIVGIIIYSKMIYIPDNSNLKISIDWWSAPSLIETYYFYDDTIIKTSYSAGVLPSGPSSSTSTTKYYFNEKINLSEIRSFIDNCPKTNINSVEITEKDGTIYYIDDDKNSDDSRLAHGELLTEIIKITNKSVRKHER